MSPTIYNRASKVFLLLNIRSQFSDNSSEASDGLSPIGGTHFEASDGLSPIGKKVLKPRMASRRSATGKTTFGDEILPFQDMN